QDSIDYLDCLGGSKKELLLVSQNDRHCVVKVARPVHRDRDIWASEPYLRVLSQALRLTCVERFEFGLIGSSLRNASAQSKRCFIDDWKVSVYECCRFNRQSILASVWHESHHSFRHHDPRVRPPCSR